jgi:hypothetical protein
MAKTKITSELIAFADYAMMADDKKLSVIGIFDKVFVRTLPASQAKMAFVVVFVGEPQTEEKVTLKIMSPSKKEEFKAPVDLKFGENGKFNFVSNFEGFPFKEVGTHSFLFEKDDKTVVSHTLDVIMVKEDEQRVAN